MVEQINIQTIILLGVVVIGVWEFAKKIMEMLSEEIEENGQIVVENESEFLSCRK